MPAPTRSRNRFSLMLHLTSTLKTSDASSVGKSTIAGSLSAGSIKTATSSLATISESLIVNHAPISNPISPSQLFSAPSSSFLSAHQGSTGTGIPPLNVSVTPAGSSLPVTTNELDPKEKMKLLKKARKLSKVLGEVNIGITTDITNQSDLGMRVDNRRKTSKKMSWGPAQSQAAEWVPSEPETSKQHFLSRHPVPVPPIEPASPSSLSKPASSTSVLDTRYPVELGRPSMDPSESSHSHEVEIDQCSVLSDSSILPSPPPFDRIHRARLAKLSRHLGENIPSELVLSPVPHKTAMSISLSPREVNFPSTSFQPPMRPETLGSARSRQKDKWRRKSMDLPPPTPLLSPSIASTLKGFSHQTASHSNLKRSKSLWSKGSAEREREEQIQDSAAALKNSEQSAPVDQENLTDKQKAMIIKRARKMAQLFGTEPPPSLYHIPSSANESSQSVDIHPESLALRITPSLSELSSTTHLHTVHRHSSSSSVSSISSEPSTPTPRKDSPSLRSRKSESDHPPTPPPFSQIARAEISKSPLRIQSDMANTSAFRQRRLRAAKLSRFFGVAYHDISETLSADPPPTPYSPSMPRIAPEEPPKMSNIAVNVKIEPGGFWGALMDGRRQNIHGADMNDVIDKLRQMRSA